MRSRQEHIDLMWGDVEMKATSTGEQYLEYNEKQTKTRQGQVGVPGNLLLRCLQYQVSILMYY